MKFDWGLLFCDYRPVKRTAQRLPASHDWRGTRYEWEPTFVEGQAALDVERLDTPLPAIVPGELVGNEFWAAWTRAEALCKLFNVPILHWIRTQPLAVPAFQAATLAMPDTHPNCRTYTGFWAEKNLMFTCAWIDSGANSD